MGLRGITLNTPPEEEAHILAEDDAAIYQSIFGEDGVFTIGDRMKATVINNNQVRVSNGVICVGGHIARTVYGDYSDMTIENGEISKNRNDIITAVFSTTGEKGIDKFKIEVKKGTPGVVAEDPELTKENLYEGGKLRELPLWRVKLEGINIIGVEQMFKIIHKIPDLEEMIESLNGKLENTFEEYSISPYTYTIYKFNHGNQKFAKIHGTWTGSLGGSLFNGFYQSSITNLAVLNLELGLQIKRMITQSFYFTSSGGALIVVGLTSLNIGANSINGTIQFLKSQQSNNCRLEWDIEVELL